MTRALPRDLTEWLAAQAEGIDADDVPATLTLPRLADAGLGRVGVPAILGGVQAIAAVAQKSLAAAFML